MPTFWKRPLPVQAVQFTMNHMIGYHPLPAGVTKVCIGDPQTIQGAAVQWYVVTAHGQKAFLERDDWIVAEPDNRGHYPVKPDIFARTYDTGGRGSRWEWCVALALALAALAAAYQIGRWSAQ